MGMQQAAGIKQHNFPILVLRFEDHALLGSIGLSTIDQFKDLDHLISV